MAERGKKGGPGCHSNAGGTEKAKDEKITSTPKRGGSHLNSRKLQ